MKNKKKYVILPVLVFFLIIAKLPVEVSAHSLDAWAKYFTVNKARNEGKNGAYQFAFSDMKHIDGNTMNYCWENVAVKQRFADNITNAIGIWNKWGDMIKGVESSDANSHVKI